jgi:hypothetical protein
MGTDWGGDGRRGAIESIDGGDSAFSTIANLLSLLFFHGTAEVGGSGRNRGLTLGGAWNRLTGGLFDLDAVVIAVRDEAVFTSHMGGVLATKSFLQIEPGADDGIAQI